MKFFEIRYFNSYIPVYDEFNCLKLICNYGIHSVIKIRPLSGGFINFTKQLWLHVKACYNKYIVLYDYKVLQMWRIK